MATAQPPDRLTFSADSLDFRDEIRNRLWERMRERAVEHVRAEHRERVTQEDVKATLGQAIRDVMAEFGIQITVD